MARTPPADVEVDEELVRRLLLDQHPDLAHLPIVKVDVGWDNFIFRLGDELSVRLPRRKLSSKLIVNEQRWLPQLAPKLTLDVPSPIRFGVAGISFPWRWSVAPWLEGQPASQTPLHASEALKWSKFLRSLHKPAPSSAPENWARGVPLAQREEAVRERMDRLSQSTAFIITSVEEAWQLGLQAPSTAEKKWIHGDLHAGNVLVQNGCVTGVIDWGDITAGDVATDLASIWMLFDDPVARADALKGYKASDDEVTRARAWAVLFGVMLLDTGLVDNPRHAAMGTSTLRNVAADVVASASFPLS